MGFGYLFIGYLVTYVLIITASALNIGFLAWFVGYGAMLLGLFRLRRYCHSFNAAAVTLFPLLLLTVYRTLESLSTSFLWNLSFVNETVGAVIGWLEFGFTMLFQACLLSAIRELSMRVELKRLAAAAIRNSIMVLMYGLVYVICYLPLSALESVRPYFGLSLGLLNLAWIFCNLWLLLSCTKNICAEGEEDLQPHRYRWEFLNRIGDAFGKNFQKASDQSRADVEAYLQKKQEKRAAKDAVQSAEKKKIRHHKKKK